MKFDEAIRELKTTYSRRILESYGYDNLRKKYTSIEPMTHNNGDSTPSMSICKRGDSYSLKDFAGDCKNYSSIDLIMISEGLEFAEAVRRGAEICGFQIEADEKPEYSSDLNFIVNGLRHKAKTENFIVKEVLETFHYLYKNASGEKIFDKYRVNYIDGNGKRNKYFYIGREKNGYVKNLKSGEYAASICMYGDFRQYAEGETLHIVEGEKCCDVCRNRGIENVVTAGSSNDWKSKGKGFAPFFKGVNVIVYQDNDSAGESLTRDIISALYETVSSIKIIVPDTSKEKADIADFFANGGTVEQLQQMEAQAPIYKEENEPVQNTATDIDLSRFHHHNKDGIPTAAYDFEIFKYIVSNYSIFVCGMPYLYCNGVYVADRNGTKIKQIIRSLLYPQFVKARTINQIFNLIVDAEELQKDFSSLNNHPKSCINFLDVMVDIKTMQKIPHSPEYLSINQIPFKFSDIEKAAEGKEVEKFFDFIFSNAEDRQMFLEFAGLCFTVDTSQQRFLTLCGQGGTGKSVLIRILENATGEANTSNVSMQDLSKRFSTSLLVAKTLNSCADLSVEALEDSSTLKRLLGEDVIMAEFKGQDAFMFKNYAKLLFSTNMLPVITAERTNGFYRRMLILRMDRQPEKPDIGLADRLIKETPYFIRLAVEALHGMYKRGIITISENSKKAVLQMRKDSDVTESWLNDNCTIGAGLKIERTEAFKDFEAYCQDEERQPLTKNGFFKALRTKNFLETKSGENRYFVGLTLSKKCPNIYTKSVQDGFITVSDEDLSELPFD